MSITNNAKGLISIIAYEVRLVDERLKLGVIKQEQALGCILERLSAKAKSNVDLKTFLTTMAHIPEDEDSGDEYPWAEDKREQRDHVAYQTTGESKGTGPGSVPIEEDEHWPQPGERIC